MNKKLNAHSTGSLRLFFAGVGQFLLVMCMLPLLLAGGWFCAKAFSFIARSLWWWLSGFSGPSPDLF